uniref:Uncharacterized protein n=1 Tax=Scophthalmus maximus TaxID=52904 RepID=A0A8D3A5S3_SCOMX
MEHHLRNALWMFVFVGYLQAYPLTTADRGNNPKLPCDAFQRDDLDFKKELDGVSCVSYFTIKTMYLIVQQTFGPFKYSTSSPQANSTECQWENKPFAHFVEDMTSVVQQSAVNCSSPAPTNVSSTLYLSNS